MGTGQRGGKGDKKPSAGTSNRGEEVRQINGKNEKSEYAQEIKNGQVRKRQRKWL